MSPECFFYSLRVLTIEQFVLKLVEKCLERGWRSAIQSPNLERLKSLDQALWTFDRLVFLPHGMDSDPYPEEQPVLLTQAIKNVNQANVRIFIDEASDPQASEAYCRLCWVATEDQPEMLAAMNTLYQRLRHHYRCFTWSDQPS